MKVVIGTLIAVVALVVYFLIGEVVIRLMDSVDGYQEAKQDTRISQFAVEMLVIICWPLLLLGMMVVGALGFFFNLLVDLYYRFKR